VIEVVGLSNSFHGFSFKCEGDYTKRAANYLLLLLKMKLS